MKTTTLIGEKWEKIKGYSEHYLISSAGRVYSIRNNIFLKKSLVSSGYESVAIRNDKGKVRTAVIHILVATAFVLNKKNKPQINHIDGNKLNNNHLNLEWCTAKENKLHAINMGLCSTSGEEHPDSKLTEDQVVFIRRLYESSLKFAKSKRTMDFSISRLAKIFNVNMSTMSKVIKRKTWKHI